jgi:sarcosine oxidase subunit alpha
MTQPFRVAAGGRIDRSRALRFTFDGKAFEGYAGDTLASALLANGVHMVGRSFKYHRPRGILSAGPEEPNALVTIDRGTGRVTPNLRATQVELYDGLIARSQNRWPSLGFDLGSAAGFFAPLLSAGFYYKSFMWPPSFWKRLYEPAIRRAAGLGRAPVAADPDAYSHQYAHCDVLVIGGGPAGLAAALAASGTGARVTLCDEQAEPGGSLLSQPGTTIDGLIGADWVGAVIAEISGRVTLLPRTTAFGWYPGGMIGLVQRLTDHLAQPGRVRERLWHVRAERVILAAGAIERPLVFPGNDRPGVMLAGAARTYLHRYGAKVGNRAVVAAADDSAYVAAADLHAAGMTIAAIADARPAPDSESEAVAAVRALGIPVHPGTMIAGTEGRFRVRSVKLSNRPDIVPCDTVLMSGGWTPSVHLYSQSRRPLLFDPATGTFLPSDGSVGACAGTFDLAACLRDGTVTGGGGARPFAVAGVPGMVRSGPPFAAAPHPKAFVDFQNDVTSKDLRIATDEGFVSIEHLKRYTTTGMATDQGKTSNLNALGTVAGLTGRPADAVGLTTFRPPYTPVTFGALAGPFRDALYAPVRLPPIATPGGVLEDVGLWKRARCFPAPGETIDAAVARECRAVRNAAGIFDASTLGKIEVAGPDAAEFLNRIYTGDFTTLAPGRCRYAVLLGEDGFVRDDGIVARLAEDRFHVTTTTGGAAFVPHHMEDYRQTEFFDLRAWPTPVTEQWAVIAVQGPGAGDILAPFVAGIDLGAMPHMSVREGHIADIPVRLFRVSFTGETGFEIKLPPARAQQVWDSLLRSGATRYGTDAMHLLRAEKGYIVVGQETDGTVTLDDLGLSWTIGRKKRDFVGKRSMELADLRRPDRKQLVGLLPKDRTVLPEEGAQVTLPGQSASIGHVTSSYRGAVLALVAGGRARTGQTLHVQMVGRRIEVTVVDPVFHDKPNDRLRPRPIDARAALPLAAAEAAPPRAATQGDGVRITPLPSATLLSVRAGNAAATGIGMALGVLLPTVPCRTVTARERVAFWLGPDEWLVQAPEHAFGLVALARNGAGAHPASVVDVSSGILALEVAGPRATWCLNGFCALDLALRAFPVGMCTRTVLGKAEVVLSRTGPDVFQVRAGRSLLPYVRACLDAAKIDV